MFINKCFILHYNFKIPILLFINFSKCIYILYQFLSIKSIYLLIVSNYFFSFQTLNHQTSDNRALKASLLLTGAFYFKYGDIVISWSI